MKNNIAYFGQVFRNYREQIAGISLADRRYHFYAIGKTGVGKTTMLENMIVSDILSGQGLALIDPHGDLAERILDFIPSSRISEVIYFSPSDTERPIGFNILEKKDSFSKHLIASSLVSVFKKVWIDSWGPRLEHLLRNCVLALLDYPGSTLLGIMKILIDEKFRDKVVKGIEDPVVRLFWQKEFLKYPDRFLAEVISPLQNKIGAFLTNLPIRNIVGQTKSSFDLEKTINKGGIFIANLSKGLLGEEVASLLGSLLITKLELAAMKRASLPEDKRSDFFLYIDEFQSFTTQSFVDILSQARKYRLNLILTHQYLAQVDERIRNAVLGNVGTIVVFRVGPEDAQVLEKEFQLNYSWLDLINSPPYEIYFKVMENGRISGPLRGTSLPPLSENFKQGNKDKIKKFSRHRYGRDRKEIERKIERWLSSH